MDDCLVLPPEPMPRVPIFSPACFHITITSRLAQRLHNRFFEVINTVLSTRAK
jgi:hypothetical protein